MLRPTHEDGIAEAEAIAAEYGVPLVELRWFAADHLAKRMAHEYPDGDYDIGSSDVSIHLSTLGNYEPEVLREEAERIRDRDRLVRTVSASTGKSYDDTLAALRELFAPIEA